MTATPGSVEQFCAQHFTIRADRIAADLRRLAERVEQEASRVDRVGKPGTPSYAGVAADVVHAVMNALPNLNFHGLVVAAQDADRARLTERTTVDEA